jgi:hypothetical protein
VDLAEFEHTVAIAVIGRARGGILQIGDSCIALVRSEGAALACPPQNGDYANETFFVSLSSATHSLAFFDIIRINDVTALFGFTDGLSHKWIHGENSKPARCVEQLAAKLAKRDWGTSELKAYLSHETLWAQSDDDRGVAYPHARCSL